MTQRSYIKLILCKTYLSNTVQFSHSIRKWENGLLYWWLKTQQVQHQEVNLRNPVCANNARPCAGRYTLKFMWTTSSFFWPVVSDEFNIFPYTCIWLLLLTIRNHLLTVHRYDSESFSLLNVSEFRKFNESWLNPKRKGDQVCRAKMTMVGAFSLSGVYLLPQEIYGSCLELTVYWTWLGAAPISDDEKLD